MLEEQPGDNAEFAALFSNKILRLIFRRKSAADLKLGDVEETALIPLSNRASETQRKNARIIDPKAVEIIKSLGVDTQKYDKLITHECVVARTIMFDRTLLALLKEYPNAAVVNMGCGLDDRFSRVDNGKIKWFDVDLPDSIEVRRKVYAETERRRMIGANILETGWMESIVKEAETAPVLMVAEGLFMYFSKEDTRKLLNTITTGFVHGYLLVEMMRQSMMNEKRHDTVKNTNAKFGWGTNSGKEFEELDKKLHLVSEHSFAEQLLRSKMISKLIGLVTYKINNRLAVFEW